MPRHRYVWIAVVAAAALTGALVVGYSTGGTRGRGLGGKGEPSASTSPVLSMTGTGAATPPANVCGSWAASNGAVGQPIASLYGPVRSCVRVGQGWIITTLGAGSANGVIAEYSCGNDIACRNGQNPHPLTGWVIYTAPGPGGITLLAILNAQEILVDVGGQEFTFNVTTHQWRKD